MVTLFMKKSLAMPPLQCTPGFVDQIPFKIRKICVALSTIYELSNAMESYIDDNGSMDQCKLERVFHRRFYFVAMKQRLH
jgi:hypothetical protein